MNVNSDFIRIGMAAKMIGTTCRTIRRWYKWYEKEEFEKPEGLVLPKYEYKDKTPALFFRKEDIKVLAEFKHRINTVNKGCMAEFNAVLQWGKRGKKVLSKKGKNFSEIRGKLK